MANVTKIKNLIKEQGLSQAYVCSKIGKRRTYISECAAGKDKIDETILIQLADILNTTPEYLRDETDDPTKKKPLTEPDEKLDGNILIIRGRDGRYIRKVLTDKEIESFETLFKNLPDLPDDL